MIGVLSILFTAGVFMVFAALASTFRKPARVDTLVKQYTEPRMLEDVELSQPFTTRIVIPATRGIARALGRLTPKYFAETTRLKLEMAGNPYHWTIVEFLGMRVLTALAFTVFFAFLFGALSANLGVLLLLSVTGFVLGFYIPVFWLNLKVRNRQQEIRRDLPDALDLLTICVEAGLGFDAAMAKVADKWNKEISKIFGRAMVEMRLGKSRQVALHDMANRTGVIDLTSFVAAIMQADQLGTPIAQVMRIQSEQMRVLRRQRAQEQANQAPVKMVFPLVFFIFPALFVVILGPALIRLLIQHPF